MKILCIFGQHNYGNPNRGESYEYNNFIPALRNLGHKVYFFESWNRTVFGDFSELNFALLKTIEEQRPDIIFSVMFTYEIWLETWEIIRDAGIATTINWTTDDSWKYKKSSRLLAPVFHSFTTTYPDVLKYYYRDGITNVLLTQWAASSVALQKPRPAKECEYTVSFVGTAHGRRHLWIDELKKRGIDVACFGHGWPTGAVAAADIPKIIRNSVISLNFTDAGSCLDGLHFGRIRQIKARTFEVPGAGGFLLTEWAKYLDKYYNIGKEIISFRNIDELDNLILYYLSHHHERDLIANAGYQRTKKEHVYENRLKELIIFAVERRNLFYSHNKKTPSGSINWELFQQAVIRHKITHRGLLFCKIITALCNVIWGPERGPRAARQIVFELSWRLVGSKTYSAASFPGRYFYTVS